MRKIVVTLNTDGSLQYEVSGVKGAKCHDLTKAIRAISNTVLETKNTGEFCQTETQQNIKA